MSGARHCPGGPTFLLDVATYEELLEQLELLRDIRKAEARIAKGEGIPHGRAKSQILRRLKR